MLSPTLLDHAAMSMRPGGWVVSRSLACLLTLALEASLDLQDVMLQLVI